MLGSLSVVFSLSALRSDRIETPPDPTTPRHRVGVNRDYQADRWRKSVQQRIKLTVLRQTVGEAIGRSPHLNPTVAAIAYHAVCADRPPMMPENMPASPPPDQKEAARWEFVDGIAGERGRTPLGSATSAVPRSAISFG